MTIPDGSNFPIQFDNDENLYLVKDSLRLRLYEDYMPGDKSIIVEGELSVMEKWPSTGLITLTEQCSEVDERAISFYYNGFFINEDNTATFENLELLSNFNDVNKLKKITNVTQNVMDRHHNQIKDAVIAVQNFIGTKDTIDDIPFGETLEGRTNFLRNLALSPKAWFTADKRVGIVPFDVEFKDLSFRLATDTTNEPVTITWDFGDNTASTVSLISVTDEVPDDAIDVLVYDEDGGVVKKSYIKPGIYDVKVKVKNQFGEDECHFPNYITARVEAPKEAIIRIRDDSSQISTPGNPPDGPFIVTPKIRSSINTLINFEIEEGENPAQIGYSFGGELLDGNKNPIDPIVTYTWSFGDNLIHNNSIYSQAAYNIGGIYDLKLRVDTEFGAYRITTYENCIDIVEDVNLWLWNYQSTNTIKSYEYGLISQTFKLTNNATAVVSRDDSFLNNVPNSNHQKSEFRKNVGFTKRSNTSSGKQGSSLIYYSSGRQEHEPVSSETIEFLEFNGFLGTYIPRNPISRPWNWVSFNANNICYFILGSITGTRSSNQSKTNLVKQELNLSSLSVNEITMSSVDFNNASELMDNVSEYSSGLSVYGHYSVYRSTWKDSTGYLARNDGVGPFFRIKSFYKTVGSIGNPFQTFKKLQDIQGTTKLEGELVNLIDGIYIFNNTGSISRYDDVGNVWSSTGPGANSSVFRRLQDTSVLGFDNKSNTCFAVSDGDRRVYISFDYSSKSFIKFDQTTKTFSLLGDKPVGEQFVIGVY